jgi:hypothetical protein
MARSARANRAIRAVALMRQLAQQRVVIDAVLPQCGGGELLTIGGDPGIPANAMAM